MTIGNTPAKAKNLTEPFRKSSALFHLSIEDLEFLRHYKRQFSSGVPIVQEGEEFGCIIVALDGWLSTSKSLNTGEEQLLDFVLPGDFVDPFATDQFTANITVETISDAKVALPPRSVWHNLLGQSPNLAWVIEKMQVAERARFTERILRLGQGSARTRVAYALLEFCVRLHSNGNSYTSGFHIPLTQKHIAAFTGLSSVHVSRTLSGLLQEGLVETRDHMDIRIVDPEGLGCIAGIDVEHLTREITPFGA